MPVATATVTANPTPTATKDASATTTVKQAESTASSTVKEPSKTLERSNFFTDEDALPDAVDAEPVSDKSADDKKDDAKKGADDDVETTSEKTTDKATETEKVEDVPPEPRTNRELKRVYENVKKANKQLTARAQELEARIAELDGIASTAKSDTGPLAEQLAAANKRIEEYEGRLRLKAYEESDEFKTKHLAPFKRTEARAFNDVRQLEYIEGVDEDTQQPRTRPATVEDFIEIYNLPAGKAYGAAKRAFGDSFQLVMNHYHDLHRQQEDMKEAIAEYRNRGAEEEKKTQAHTAQEREAADRMWRIANQETQAKYYRDLGIDPDDAEMKETLAKGYGPVQKLFSGNGNMTLAEKVGLQASVLHRAALFGVTRKQLLAAKAELAAALKDVEELRGSKPGKPKPKSDAVPVGDYKDLAEEMAAYPMEG
jgi:hypothetical protein